MGFGLFSIACPDRITQASPAPEHTAIVLAYGGLTYVKPSATSLLSLSPVPYAGDGRATARLRGFLTPWGIKRTTLMSDDLYCSMDGNAGVVSEAGGSFGYLFKPETGVFYWRISQEGKYAQNGSVHAVMRRRDAREQMNVLSLGPRAYVVDDGSRKTEPYLLLADNASAPELDVASIASDAIDTCAADLDLARMPYRSSLVQSGSMDVQMTPPPELPAVLDEQTLLAAFIAKPDIMASFNVAEARERVPRGRATRKSEPEALARAQVGSLPPAAQNAPPPNLTALIEHPQP
jgi:hypothetical protein